MAHTYHPPQFWTCDCDRTTGGHIVAGLYAACVFCGKHRSALKEIVVPSGMGGVFALKIPLHCAAPRRRPGPRFMAP